MAERAKVGHNCGFGGLMLPMKVGGSSAWMLMAMVGGRDEREKRKDKKEGRRRRGRKRKNWEVKVGGSCAWGKGDD